MIPRTTEEKLKSLSRNGTIILTGMGHERGFVLRYFSRKYPVDLKAEPSIVSGTNVAEIVNMAYACSDRFSIDRWGKVLTEYDAKRNGKA